ncbi:MAG: T9SS type A sorting domain-containing protein, partial [Crocinitomicaceae bacterium]|nr:T9SS type A sorting domain-containing protein [Crocinitomicaceae bacterium]
FDSVFVHAYSNSPALISSANINVTRTNPYSPNSSDNDFLITATPEAGQSGIADIDLLVIDGYDTLVYNINVTVHALPAYTAGGTNPTTCLGSDGMITLSGLTPSQNYGVSYFDGTSTQGPTTIAANTSGEIEITGLTEGSYSSFSLLDQSTGCSGTLAGPVLLSDPAAPTFSISTVNPICNGGSDGSFTIAGLSPGTNYNVTYTLGGTVGPTSLTSSALGEIQFNGLTPGILTNINVENLNSCSTNDAGPYSIVEPTVVSYTSIITSTSCNGICDGEIALTGTGGTPSYQYSIDGGATFIGTGTFASLCVGTYDIVILDNNGCMSAPSNETVTEPSVLTPTPLTDQFICEQSNVTLNGSATGGTPPYSYAWDQGVTNGVPFAPSVGTVGYTLSVTDNNGCSAADSLEITVYSLPTINAGIDISACDGDMINLAGSGGSSYTWDNGINDGVDFTQAIGTTLYIVTGTDGNGCQNTDTVAVTINSNPSSFSIATTNPTSCGANDGYMTLSGLDASANYDINYNNGTVQGPFTLTTNGAGDLVISSLSAGTYSDITVTNGNNCSTVDAGPIGLSDPSAPTVNAGSDITICEEEPVELTASNSENALISWDNGILDGHTFYPSVTTTYTVTASSAGCTATDQVTVTVNALPDVALTITDATCNATDGSVSSNITNGLAPYDVYWSNGTSGTSINTLAPALYYINVTDANGCYTMEVASVSSTAISASGIETHNNCPGDEDGTIDLTVIGTAPFTYSWSNGDITEDITGLTSGQYEVMITDGNGCMGGASFVITEPLPIYGELTSTNATCGSADGSISSVVLGGTPGYTFQWKDNLGTDLIGENSSTLNNYVTGAYSLEITDVSGCTHELFTGISENNGPIVTVDSLIASTCANDGAINMDVNTTFDIDSYNWNNGATTEDITNIGAGQYNLIVQDINGCYGVATAYLPAVLPSAVDICIVSVDTTTNTNLIVWEKPITDEIAYFNVYRESSIAGMFQLVDSVSYNQVSEYNDTIAYPGLRSWRYKLGTVDTCGNESILSEAHKTMHITLSSSAGTYNLAWDHYEGFAYSTYYIWRHTDQSGWIEIDQVATSITTYTNVPPTEDGIDYMVEIQPPMTCTSTLKATDYNSSRSNKSEDSGIIQNGPDDSGFAEDQIDFELYPNPTEGQVKIVLGEWSDYTISLIDISGKLIYETNINGENSLLDLTHLESGSYLIKVNSDKGEGISKLVKH